MIYHIYIYKIFADVRIMSRLGLRLAKSCRHMALLQRTALRGVTNRDEFEDLGLSILSTSGLSPVAHFNRPFRK